MTSLLRIAGSTLAAVVLVACAPPDPEPRVARAASWLRDVTVEAGLGGLASATSGSDFYLPGIMRSGGALFDYDGDGDLDVYLTHVGGSDDEPRNRLFRQDPGMRFADVTTASGIAHRDYGMGVALADVDRDGDLDVYLTNHGPDRLYRNRGDGTFAADGPETSAAADGWSASAAFCDYDGDSFVDLFVTRYLDYDPTKHCVDAAGRPDYCSPKVFPAMSDVLLHNRGDGTFEDVSLALGISGVRAAGLGVVCEDLDGDGRLDFYVANDDYRNHLWVRRDDGTFEDRALLLGAAYNVHGRTEAGMGVVAADLDGDLQLDLFLTHLANETNTIYRNRGRSRGFEDATGVSGLAGSSLVHTGFGVAVFDLELDGDPDLVVANGRVTRGRRGQASVLPDPWDRFAEPNQVFVGTAAGRFDSAGPEVAEFTTPVEISRGLAAGDIDGDGDVDLLVAQIGSGPRLYRNDAPRRGRWLSVSALDGSGGTAALGAQVTVVAGGVRRMRTISGGTSYLSASPAVAHFGLGDSAAVERIDVRWPGGATETFDGSGVDRSVTLVRGAGRPSR